VRKEIANANEWRTGLGGPGNLALKDLVVHASRFRLILPDGHGENLVYKFACHMFFLTTARGIIRQSTFLWDIARSARVG
jgi:hypothetical protein